MSTDSDPPKPVLVLDKSFVQAAKGDQIATIGKDHILVVTSSFYYEAFQSPNESRTRILAALPEFRRIHTAELCAAERRSLRPAYSFETPRLSVNPDFISGERILNDAEHQAVRDFGTLVVDPQVETWREIMKCGVVGFEDSELDAVRGNRAEFIELCGRLRETEVVRRIASEIGLGFADEIDHRWITFRRIQTMVLHGLTLRHLYPDPRQSRNDVDLEHDIHDIDYLTLAVHAGAFATNESRTDFRKLGWRFKFLRPDGKLLQVVAGEEGPIIQVS